MNRTRSATELDEREAYALDDELSADEQDELAERLAEVQGGEVVPLDRLLEQLRRP